MRGQRRHGQRGEFVEQTLALMRECFRVSRVLDFEKGVEIGACEKTTRLAAADDEQRQPRFGRDGVKGSVEVGQQPAREHIVRLAGHVDLKEGAAVAVLLDGDGFGLEEGHEAISIARSGASLPFRRIARQSNWQVHWANLASAAAATSSHGRRPPDAPSHRRAGDQVPASSLRKAAVAVAPPPRYRGSPARSAMRSATVIRSTPNCCKIAVILSPYPRCGARLHGKASAAFKQSLSFCCMAADITPTG